MKDPNPINLTPSTEVEAAGWAAEARDSDGHLVSTVAWLDQCTTHENLQSLGEFIAEYETDGTVTVFVRTVAARIA